jgi:histidinol-phosphate/aromatic aminotransferase/cobyric acid decarboxylase-like protein
VSGTGSIDIPPAGSHGGDAAAIARALGIAPEVMVDLSASMNPFAPDVAALIASALRSDRGLIGRYPDSAAATESLASSLGVDADLVVLTNGGAEAIALIATEVTVADVVEPEFSLYRRHLAAVESGAPRWRSNPSNPLGALAAGEDVAAVWDEAFYPIATGAWTRGDNEAWRVGSLTKLWNCPGLRLGYVIAPDPDSARRVRQRQPQWAVNGLALAIFDELLALTDLPGWHAAISKLRLRFADAVSALGYQVRPTDVNWVLVEHDELRTQLAPFGVVVRDCTSFGLPGLARVALPSAAQHDHVIDAFAAVIER